MDQEERHPLVDVAFALAVILFSAIVYWGTLGLPPPRYEPIGSAALPRGLAVVMTLLSLIVLVRAALRWRQTRDLGRSGDEAVEHRQRPLLAIAVFLVIAAYVAAMDMRLVGFIPGSIVAFILIGAMLTQFDMRRLPWMAGFVIILVVVIQLVFQRFFYIDLP